MEAAIAFREHPPVEMTGPQAGELAPVIQLIPSPEEKPASLPDLLSLDPRHLVKGVGWAASLIKRNVLGSSDESAGRHPERVILTDKGREHLFLVTEPDPDTGVDRQEALNTVFLPGLTEMGDRGSAREFHNAYAKHHPDRRVITRATEGISHTGKLRHTSEGGDRRLADMAADNLVLLPRITEDGPIELSGTSLGTYIAMLTAEQDLAANPNDQLNLRKLKLVASAVVARDIPESESFRDAEVNEDIVRAELTMRFLQHLAPDLLRMVVSNPAEILKCAPIIGAYALFPHKAPSRTKAILADFNDVQQGMEWSTVKRIAQEHEIWVLGGQHDPLVQFQAPQWEALAKLYPRHVHHKIVAGKGHLMTADAHGTVKELAKMEAVQPEFSQAA
jgi:pimeloyl-ACP methyl ester carboxylesterase